MLSAERDAYRIVILERIKMQFKDVLILQITESTVGLQQIILCCNQCIRSVSIVYILIYTIYTYLFVYIQSIIRQSINSIRQLINQLIFLYQ